jgi:hypothetical protein
MPAQDSKNNAKNSAMHSAKAQILRSRDRGKSEPSTKGDKKAADKR